MGVRGFKCGNDDWQWMTLADDPKGNWFGYTTAAAQYCYHITHSSDILPLVLASGQRHEATISRGFQLTYGQSAMVLCK
jgi:hypothetical protein